MSSNYVMPADAEQWLSGIGARLPHINNRQTAQRIGEEDGVVDLDDADAAADDDTERDNRCAQQQASNDPQRTVGSDPDAAADEPSPQPQTSALDAGTAEPAAQSDDPDRPSTRRYNPWVVGALVAVTAVATVITATLTFVNTPSPNPVLSSPTTTTARTAPPPPRAAASPAPVNENADGPLPFTASSDCDNAGSTPAQSVAEPGTDNPWVCVLHGAGQVLTLQLGQPGMPQAYVITGVSIIPGAIGPQGRRPSDPDPWLAHRVVTLLQWHFSDPANLFLDQNTFNHRGDVPLAVPRVLASKIIIIIRQTSRPPTDATPTPSSDAGMTEVLGPPPMSTADPTPSGGDSGPQTTDPSDGTFAVASIKVFGHKAV
ncbi:hypothetical protein [Mycobacterium attenuatum]|uniref:hypothetical protein n=1 Tax=Mycobacterium attenuatum TaxID=2341086 RepID=UPI000F0429E6|nr:hypothetical protein [Mycobacterium attenuatum]VBA62386.1 hypothetical protein LAUMK41_05777 [Mycobacterium attenuatum]